MSPRLLAIPLLGVLLLLSSWAPAQVQVDARYVPYKEATGVSGTIKSVGSDTMNNLMALWSEGFRKVYPAIQAEIEGKGSSTAPPALINGSATFGPMSRRMKGKEQDRFEHTFGYKASFVRTAIDMLAVYVHRDNPIAKTGLTLRQVDAIFSKTRKGRYPKDIRTWGDLGLKGAWANKPITIYGRNSASGTYGYFKKHALFKGDYKDSVKEQPGSSAVVNSVANDKYAIGYSGIGYKTAGVGVVPLAQDEDSDFVPASPDRVSDYPLSRYLHIYINYRPSSKLDPLRREFLKYVFSLEGQKDVIRDGYLPVSASIAKKDLGKLGIKLLLRENADN